MTPDWMSSCTSLAVFPFTLQPMENMPSTSAVPSNFLAMLLYEERSDDHE